MNNTDESHTMRLDKENETLYDEIIWRLLMIDAYREGIIERINEKELSIVETEKIKIGEKILSEAAANIYQWYRSLYTENEWCIKQEKSKKDINLLAAKFLDNMRKKNNNEIKKG